jgi:ABC-type polysaccharide/polyol phosphate export permease
MSLVGSLKAALQDLYGGAALMPLWWRVALEQTVTRYRRTLLGPFWLASTTLATAFSLSIVFGSIFGGNFRDSMPFIMIGVVSWSLTGGLLPEAANTFVSGSGIMQVQKLPVSFHAYLQISRALINFAHQVIGLWLVLLIMKLAVMPHWHLLLTLPIVLLTGFFLAIPLGMLSLRFRDINYMVSFVSQAMFMMTPVFWRRTQVPDHMHWIVDLNPFAHLLEIIRQPIQGHPAPTGDMVASLMFLATVAVLAVGSLTLFRRRVVFWL